MGEEFEDVFALGCTTGHDRPDTLVKANAGIAVCPLRVPSVQHHEPVFCPVELFVGSIPSVSKNKKAVATVSGKSLLDLAAIGMFERSQDTAEKQFFEVVEFFSKITRPPALAFSPGFEHLLDNPK